MNVKMPHCVEYVLLSNVDGMHSQDNVFHHYIYKQCHSCFQYVGVHVYLPFVTMLTILNLKTSGLLSAPGFLAHTDTVPALYWGSPLMGTKVMECLTEVEFI